jgi:predicted nucleic acid-binding protein
LPSLYGDIVIPHAVEHELHAAPELHAVFDWSLIRVVTPVSTPRVEALLRELDRGESEAIIVALELGADLLLIDERTGRDVAKRLGLRRTGLVGVLLDAKNRGLLDSVAEDLDRLVAQTTFRIHPTVRTEALRLANE